MSRYIDADKLCKDLTEMAKYQEPYKQSTILGVVSTIENVRTADVIEVRHGKWQIVESDLGYVEMRCSLCGCEHLFDTKQGYPYCPSCGAKMMVKGE